MEHTNQHLRSLLLDLLPLCASMHSGALVGEDGHHGERTSEIVLSMQELVAHHELITEGWQSVETRLGQHRMLSELAPAAYLITDAVGVIQRANRRAASQLGVPQRFLVGRPLAPLGAAQPGRCQRRRIVAAAAAATRARSLAGRGRDHRCVQRGWRKVRTPLQLLEVPASNDRAADNPSKPSAPSSTDYARGYDDSADGQRRRRCRRP
jgi:PAS domain-containing protein